MPALWTAHVPVAAATVLSLELLLQETSLDLQAASGIILTDVGATLQLLRLADAVDPSSQASCRIQDHLAELDADTWFEAIAAQTLSRSPNAARLQAIWQHSRLVAQYAGVLAESLDGIPPELAYMVGLLHEIETISLLLGEDGESMVPTVLLQHVIPSAVLAALEEAKDRGSSSMWRYLLSSAHALASAMPHFVDAPTRSVNKEISDEVLFC